MEKQESVPVSKKRLFIRIMQVMILSILLFQTGRILAGYETDIVLELCMVSAGLLFLEEWAKEK